MKSLTRLAAMALAATALTSVAAAQERTQIRIGTEGAYPPFNYFDANKELKGFEIDLANALCEKMQAECVFVAQDWDGMIPALQANKYDAIIASMSITPERQEQVDFTNKYYQTPPAIAVPKDSDIAEATPEALAGKTVGAQSSTTHANFAQAKFEGADVKLYPTSEEYKLDLESGRIDAAVDDVVVLSEWVNSPEGACCKVLGTLTPDPAIHGEGVGIALRKGEDELRERFNQAIQDIRADGTYKRINDQYFDFDAYGG